MSLIKKYHKENRVDHLLIEPSEMVVTYRLKNVLKMVRRDAKYDIGSIIALVDGPDFDLNWEERPETILNHLREADLALIGRADMIDEPRFERIAAALSEYYPRFYPLSSTAEIGLNKVFGLFN